MRRIILLAVMFITMLSTGLSKSEQLDVSSMSDSDLLRARNAIEQELLIRNEAEWAVMYDGEEYIAGENIKSGNYFIRCTNNKKGHYKFVAYSITGHDKDGKIISVTDLIDDDEIERFTLENGMTIKLVGNNAYIKPAPELPDLFMD